jgi:hypothetical protein
MNSFACRTVLRSLSFHTSVAAIRAVIRPT